VSSIFPDQLVERQALACRIFDQAAARQCLSHAYLLTGQAVDDKYLLAKLLACYLNCEHKSSDGSSCTCRNCRWIWAQAHPQAWFVLSGEESKSGRIAVEKARALSLELSKVAQCVRTIVIPDATRECFHAPAANAMLKTIEETSNNTLFLLFAPDAASVMSTIVSRCQVVPLVQTVSSLFRFTSEDKDTQEELREAVSKYAIPSFTSSNPVSEAMQWAAELESATDEGIDSHFLLDWIVFKKFEQLKPQTASDPGVSAYLDRLLSLSQTTKDQLDSYVQPKAAFESFALSLLL
jgi:DNA polymerase III delta prime subunit